VIRYLPYLLAVLWLGIRIAGGYSVDFNYERGKTIGIFTNLAIILIIILVSLYGTLKLKSTSTFLDDFRLCVKGALKYILPMMVLLIFYYSAFSYELETTRNSKYQEIISSLDTDEELMKAKTENAMFRDMSREQIMANWKSSADFIYSLKAIAGAGLLVLIIIAFAYSAIGTWLWRTVLRTGADADHKINGKTSPGQ